MTMAPSDKRVAVDTSLEKSIWPGESIRLMRKSCDAGGGRPAEEGLLEGAPSSATGADGGGVVAAAAAAPR